MKRFVFLIFLYVPPLFTQSLYFPPIDGHEWATTDPVSLGWDTTALPTLYQFLDSNHSKAFLVLKDGRMVIEKYFGSFTRYSLWYWASAGKTMTAFLVGIAQREGHLHIADISSKWLGRGWTSLPPDKEDLITVRHQLTMTTGLDDDVPDKDCTLPSCLTYKADAGTRWAYHNAPYTLLEEVLFAATHQTLNSLFFTRVRNKIGMNGLYLRSGPYNYVLFTTPRSMARFGLLILNQGIWGTDDLLQDPEYFRQMISSSQPLNPSYGYLWWLNGKETYMLPGTQIAFPGWLNRDAPADMFAAVGKNGQLLNIVPSRNLVWVRVGNAPDYSLDPTHFNNQIWQRLNAIMRVDTRVVWPEESTAILRENLLQIYPNPVNCSALITYRQPAGGPVRLCLFDIRGRMVALLVEEWKSSGVYTLFCDTGRLQIPSGIYFLHLHLNQCVKIAKMTIIK